MNSKKIKLQGCCCLIMFCLIMTTSSARANKAYEEQVVLMKKASAKKANPERTKDFERGIAEVAHSGILESAVKKGDRAPDFSLPDLSGENITLSELLEKGPVVLVWYRGGWCPYCNVHLKVLQKALPDFKAAGAQLVAISPEMPKKSTETKLKNKLDFFVLSDSGNQTAADYGLVFQLPEYVADHYDEFFNLEDYNGDNRKTLPLAAAYVINTDGTVAYAFLEADYKKRAEPSELLQQVKLLQA